MTGRLKIEREAAGLAKTRWVESQHALAKRYQDSGLRHYLMLGIERDRRDYLTSGKPGSALDQTIAKHNLSKLFRW